MTILWIVIALFGLFLAWNLFKVLAGALAPAGKTGRLYLKKELQKAGIDPRYIPDACIDEMVSEAIHIARLMSPYHVGRDKGFTSHFVSALDGTAATIMLWRQNASDQLLKDNWCCQILEKYSVHLP